jgi:hypothetical protein
MEDTTEEAEEGLNDLVLGEMVCFPALMESILAKLSISVDSLLHTLDQQRTLEMQRILCLKYCHHIFFSCYFL